jgi:hypothetical protein
VDELGNAVEGNLAWKDASMTFNAGSTDVTWIFTPNNNEYKAVEGQLTITVNKAKNAPNMMSDTMNISNQYNKIGDIPLPEGWEWLATDKEIALKENATVTATAVYTGINKGNCENEAVLIRVTKNASVNGNITDTNTGNWTIQTWFTLLLVSGAVVVFVDLKSKRALRKVN